MSDIKCSPLSHSYAEFTQTKLIYGIEHFAIFCTKCADIKYFQFISEEHRERIEAMLTSHSKAD